MSAALAMPLPTLAQVEAEMCRRSLAEFVRQAWHVIEPDAPLRWNWHIDMICADLERVERGEIRDLLCNIPPGHMKSLLVSVLWPSWIWTRQPDRRFLCISYDQALSTRDNRRVRDLVTSEWYRNRFGLELRADQNQKTRFDTTAGGWRIGTSITGGKTLGEHPHFKIVDDPHTPLQTLSDLQREEVLRWFDGTLSSRGAALGAATVVIMQRLHQGDLSGHILERGGFEHVCLPMRYEPGRMEGDPRTEDGELLWPEMFPEETVRSLEIRLGATDAAGQLQQRPVPAGGAMFKREWFKLVDAMPADVIRTVRFWDVAGTDGGTGPRTAGVRMSKTKSGTYVISDVKKDRISAHGVDRLMKQTAQTDGKEVAVREEREPGSAGKAVITARARLLAGFDFRGIPSTGDKATRAQPLRAQAEAGNIYILAQPDDAGKLPDWVREFLDEVELFPVAKLKDQVDAAAGCLNDLVGKVEQKPTIAAPPLFGKRTPLRF